MNGESSRPSRAIAWEALALAALCILMARCLSSLTHARDLPHDDEALYLGWGMRVARAVSSGSSIPLPAADWAPLYVALYGIAALLTGDASRAYDLTTSVLVVLVTLLAYALLRQAGVRRAVALPSASLLLLLDLFHVLPYPGLLACAVMQAAALLVQRERDPLRRFALLAAGATLAAFARPELALPATALAAWVAIGAARARDRRGLLSLVIALAPGATLVPLLGHPFLHGRAFVAFSQHYAFTLSRRTHIAENPWLDYPIVVTRDFGPVKSVSGAFFANPGAFGRHVLYNVGELPSNVVDACALRVRLPEETGVVAHIAGGVLVAVSLLCLVMLVRAWRRAQLSGIACGGLARVGLVAALAGAPSTVLVFPRVHYLTTTLVFAGLLAACEVERQLRVRGIQRLGWALCVVPTVVVLALLPSRVDVRHPGRELVAALARVDAPRGTAILDLSELSPCGGGPYEELDIWRKDAPLFTYLDRAHVAIVVTWAPFLTSAAYAQDPDVARLLATPETAGFCDVSAAPPYRLFVRRESFPAACAPSRPPP